MKKWLFIICPIIALISLIIVLIEKGYPIWLKRRNYKQQGIKICPYCKKNISWWQRTFHLVYNCTPIHHKCFLKIKKEGFIYPLHIILRDQK